MSSSLPLACCQEPGIIYVQKFPLPPGESYNEGEGPPGMAIERGCLSRGPQGEHQWKRNVLICLLAVCIVLDA